MPLQVQDESLSISVKCMHNQKSYHFKVRPSTVLIRVYHGLLQQLAQDVPCVVKSVSEMQLVCYGHVVKRYESIHENNIESGDKLDMLLSQVGD